MTAAGDASPNRPLSLATRKVPPMMSANLRAFLDVIAYSEIGPELLAQSDNGYDLIVGSMPGRPDRFHNYRTHPHKSVALIIKGRVVVSTAAGRYQILARYADHYMRELGLQDFGPHSQDAIAVQMIRECRALDDIEAGRFADAIRKCRSRWASLPGAGYLQHENTLHALQDAFVAAGGALA